MKRLPFLYFILMLSAAEMFGQEYVPGVMLVRFSDDRAKISANQIAETISQEPAYPFLENGVFKSITNLREWDLLRKTILIRVDESIQIPILAAKIARMQGVELAEPVWIAEAFTVPNDVNAQQNYFDIIGGAQAWAISTGSKNVIIAITDTGVDYNHPDLAANLWKNPGESGGGKETNGIDDDGNGFIDDVNGWDFVQNDNTPLPSGSTHGTHVAGIAAAVTGNGTGIASLSHNVSFLPVRAGSTTIPFGYQSIAYASALGAHIINISWGATRFTQAGWEVVKAAAASGSLLIGAAGNEGSSRIYYPAGFPEVISVGAINNVLTSGNATRATFSNYNYTVDLSAPGNNIYSTLPSNTYGLSGGTSMAAPLVSALAALIKSKNPGWSMQQVRANILSTTTTIATTGHASDFLLGTGYLRAPEALGAARSNLEITGFQFTDSSAAKFDRIFEENEPLELTLSVKNYGLPATYFLSLAPGSNQLTVITNALNTGLLQSGEEKTFYGVRINTNVNAAPNASPLVYIDANNGVSSKRLVTQVQLKPTYGTVTANSIELTLGGNGRLGLLDPSSSTSAGSPFIIRGEGTGSDVSMLAEGSLMIARSTTGTPVSDAARSGTTTVGYNNDFIIRRSFVGRSTSEFQVGTAEFSDGNSLGILVNSEIAAWRNQTEEKTVILKYTISTLNTPLMGARIGLYLDFDMPLTAPSNDKVYFDAANDLIYQVDQEIAGQPSVFIGATVFGGSGSKWPILNTATGTNANFGVNDGFSDDEKRLSMFFGESDIFGGSKSGDVSFTIAGKTFDLLANSSETQHFILTHGSSKAELLANIEAAKIRIQNGIPAQAEISEKPGSFGIAAVYPNPFNPEARVEVHTAGYPASLKLFDLSGRLVQTLAENKLLSAGTQLFTIRGENLPSGVYLLKMTDTAGNLSMKKVTLVK